MSEVLEVFETSLAAIQADQHQAGEAVRPPAGSAATARLISEARAKLGVDVPEGYLAFLRASDGIDYNGLVFYSAADTLETAEGGFWQGLVAANLTWRDDPANNSLLVLGDSDLDVFVWTPATATFAQMDRIGRDRMIPYSSCAAMIDAVLTARL